MIYFTFTNPWDTARRWIIAIALVVIAICLVVREARAEDDARLREAWQIAYAGAHEKLGLNQPDQPMPKISRMEHDALCKRVGFAPKCGVWAITVTADGYADSGEVYLRNDADFSNAWGFYVLVHELVHVLQYRVGDRETTCRGWLRREELAYEVHIRALLKKDLRREAQMAMTGLYGARTAATECAIARKELL